MAELPRWMTRGSAAIGQAASVRTQVYTPRDLQVAAQTTNEFSQHMGSIAYQLGMQMNYLRKPMEQLHSTQTYRDGLSAMDEIASNPEIRNNPEVLAKTLKETTNQYAQQVPWDMRVPFKEDMVNTANRMIFKATAEEKEQQRNSLIKETRNDMGNIVNEVLNNVGKKGMPSAQEMTIGAYEMLNQTNEKYGKFLSREEINQTTALMQKNIPIYNEINSAFEQKRIPEYNDKWDYKQYSSVLSEKIKQQSVDTETSRIIGKQKTDNYLRNFDNDWQKQPAGSQEQKKTVLDKLNMAKNLDPKIYDHVKKVAVQLGYVSSRQPSSKVSPSQINTWIKEGSDLPIEKIRLMEYRGEISAQKSSAMQKGRVKHDKVYSDIDRKYTPAIYSRYEYLNPKYRPAKGNKALISNLLMNKDDPNGYVAKKVKMAYDSAVKSYRELPLDQYENKMAQLLVEENGKVSGYLHNIENEAKGETAMQSQKQTKSSNYYGRKTKQ